MRKALLLVVVSVSAMAQPTFQEVQLRVREHRTFPLQDIQRVAIGDASVVDATTVSGGLELIGVEEGRTTLLIWKVNGDRVNVLVTVGHPKGVATRRPLPPEAPAPGPAVPGHCGETTGPANDALQKGKEQLAAKDVEAARASLEKALELDPQLGAAHRLLGVARARLGEIEAAAKEYRAFVRACPRDPDAPKVRALLEQYER